LLLALKRSNIVLYTNSSAGNLRGYRKWRKISGRPRSELGKRCRDGVASLTQSAAGSSAPPFMGQFLGDCIGAHGDIGPRPYPLARHRGKRGALSY
jgi:hypothetical protein